VDYTSYTSYSIFLLVVGVVCLYLLRFATQSRNRTLRRRYETDQGQSALKRAKQRLAAPWGWPGHLPRQQAGRTGWVAALHSLAERLTRQKQLAETALSDPRRSNNIRALVEDRYGRVIHERMSEIPYQRVKRPLLRDPSEPHDQMDNLGTAKAERIRRQLQSPALIKAEARPSRGRQQGSPREQLKLQDVKLPWGW
jgi:hypothetical protein